MHCTHTVELARAHTVLRPGRRQHTSLIAALLWLLVGTSGCAQTLPTKESPKERLAKAEAMFQERCKTAGEKIYKTFENVEGIYLLKIRPLAINYGDQFALDDPYGRDLGGEAYIGSFIRGSYQANTSGVVAKGSPPRTGYLYVDAIDPNDGNRYRYTGEIKVVGKQDPSAYNNQQELKRNPSYDLNIYAFVISKVISRSDPPRFAVTYDDISTRLDREFWIAGSSLKVIDLTTNEIVAERVGYMMDRRQGDRSGGRSPWLFAADNACPSFHRNPTLRSTSPAFSSQPHQTQDFIEKVIKPKMEK